MTMTQDLIAQGVRSFEEQVPALKRLKLVFRLELKGRGDVQVFRVRVPGPEVQKGEPDDARVEVSMPRATFNELIEKDDLQAWVDAFEHGDIKPGGDDGIHKLIGMLVEKQLGRGQVKRVR